MFYKKRSKFYKRLQIDLFDTCELVAPKSKNQQVLAITMNNVLKKIWVYFIYWLFKELFVNSSGYLVNYRA